MSSIKCFRQSYHVETTRLLKERYEGHVALVEGAALADLRRLSALPLDNCMHFKDLSYDFTYFEEGARICLPGYNLLDEASVFVLHTVALRSDAWPAELRRAGRMVELGAKVVNAGCMYFLPCQDITVTPTEAMLTFQHNDTNGRERVRVLLSHSAVIAARLCYSKYTLVDAELTSGFMLQEHSMTSKGVRQSGRSGTRTGALGLLAGAMPTPHDDDVLLHSHSAGR